LIQAHRSSSTLRLLGFALLVSILVRLALPGYLLLTAGDTQAFFEVYTHEYREPALNLLSSGSYVSHGTPEIYRPPGYPLFLLSGLLLKQEALVTILLQIILSSLTVWLVFRLSLVIFENLAAALFTAFCYSLEPLSIVFCSLLMPETLMTCLLVGFLLWFCKYVKEGALGDLALSAIFLSLSGYVAAYLYFLPLLMAITLGVWRFCGKRLVKPSPSAVEGELRAARQPGVDPLFSARPPSAHIALFLAICAGLFGAWQVRNYVASGYGGFSGVFDRSIYYAQAASVVAGQQGKPEFQSAWEDLDRQLAAHAGPDARLSDELRYMRHEGFRVLLGAPLDYLQIHVKGMVRTLAGLEAHTYLRLLGSARGQPSGWDSITRGKGLMRSLSEGRRGATRAVFLVIVPLAGVAGALCLFCALAFVSRTITWTMPVATLLTVAAYILVVTGGPHGYSRYRHGIMPIVAVFAGYGLAFLLKRFEPTSFRKDNAA